MNKILSLIFCCFLLGACAPGGGGKGSEVQKPEVKTEVPHQVPAENEKSCSAVVIQNCGLYGLTDSELMEIRINLPANIEGDFKNAATNELLRTSLRSALLMTWINQYYPHAKVKYTEEEMKKYVEFFKTIKWRGN